MADTSFDTKKFMKTFIAFEESNPTLFDIQIKGHRIWDYIRYMAFYEIVCAKMESTPAPSLGTHKQVSELIHNLLYLGRWLFQKKKQYDILFLNYDRNRWFNGKFINIHTYAIIEHLHQHYKILFLDPTSLSIPVEQNYSCDLLRSWPFEMIDRIKARLTIYSAKEKKMLRKIEHQFEAAFQEKVDMVSLAKKYFSYRRQCYKRYLRLFKIYRPRLVMYSDTSNMKGIIEAARQLGIITVDFQHSPISYVNIVYNYPKSISEKQLTTLSDYILTFGEFWHSEYRLPIKKLPVGFPLFEIQQNTPWKGKTNLGNKEKNIIIIPDMVFSKNSFVEATLVLSEHLPNYTIYYKLRSEDYEGWQERYPKEFSERKNIRVIDNDHIPLYEYFRHCTFQVGINSTAIYEGMAYHLTTFVLRQGWYEEMKELGERGYIFLVSTPLEIVHKIQSRECPTNRLNINDIFKSNSLSNMKLALDGILGLQI